MNPLEATHIRPHAKELMDLCATKVEEFRLLGYDQVKLEEVWEFVCAKLPSDTHLHQLVEFILSMRVMDFMNYQTISAYKGSLS
ncbi:post-transcriptional regulator [Alicyclobacillus dauci]|uniref:Post-transcriptional regulator n=1 Tax=Alicyclobacillus dauci TaxID=1475485 RepID=A0ABY6Z6H7_9BACL|nr:post-transcriptional regulator [Alicyclobacillus dauci]WAH38432.1 post-transcriptional regulator [Alicyclobacillus dauci]